MVSSVEQNIKECVCKLHQIANDKRAIFAEYLHNFSTFLYSMKIDILLTRTLMVGYATSGEVLCKYRGHA
jgi:hypothetical protein